MVVVSPPRIATKLSPPAITLGMFIRVLSLGLSRRISTVQYVLFSWLSRVGGAVSLAARISGMARCWCLNAALVEQSAWLLCLCPWGDSTVCCVWLLALFFN